MLRLFRQGQVSFVLFKSLCSLYFVHRTPWSLCFFGPPVCCEKVLLCIVQQWTVLTAFLRCSAWPVQWFSSAWSVYCFFICLFFHLSVFSSSVFWCNVSVYCVFTGVVCFVNVFTFDLLPLTCSVVSYCLLEMIYSIQYSVYILFNWPFCLRSIWCVYDCVCAMVATKSFLDFSESFAALLLST